ncbi:hypothetical protein E4U16_000966 [Claviceps sp. LM84 group G4]|nr:hypothetical protein E4U16_000966 [Claviceps sp. LM84 group G4]
MDCIMSCEDPHPTPELGQSHKGGQFVAPRRFCRHSDIISGGVTSHAASVTICPPRLLSQQSGTFATIASQSAHILFPVSDHAAPFSLSRTPNMADYIRHAASCYMLVSHLSSLHQDIFALSPPKDQSPLSSVSDQ